MTRRSDGEKIDELEKSVARIIERLEATINAHERLIGEHAKTAVVTHDLRREVERDLALLKRDLDELKKWKEEQKIERELALLKRDLDEMKKWKEEQKREREEHARRAWAFGPNVVGALVNVLLSALVAYIVARR